MMDLLKAEVLEPEAALKLMFGAALPVSGVVHIAAVGRVADRLTVLEINETTPRSFADNYALNAVRAWADVVLTTGKILRLEPELSFEVDGPSDAVRKKLVAWRGERPKLEVAVLSSGRGLEAPLRRLTEQSPVTLFTSAGSIDRAEVPSKVELVAIPSASPRRMVQWAVRNGGKEKGERRVSVELGPSSSAELYQAPVLVSHVFLSTYLGKVEESFQGRSFLPGCDLNALFDPVSSACRIGDWEFQQFRLKTRDSWNSDRSKGVSGQSE